MAEGENIGGVNISIGADYSDVLTAFTDIQNQATQAGAATGAALSSGFSSADAAIEGTTAQLGLFAEALDSIPFADAAGQLNLFTDELEITAPKADSVAASVTEAGAATEVAGASAAEASNSFSDMAEKLTLIGESLVITDLLKEFGSEALTASDNITHASIALTTLTGSAEQAEGTIKQLEELGIADGLAMPSLLTAATRMTAILGPGTDVAGLLGKIADGAAVMGTEIESAVTRFDQLATAGMASARTLTSVGLSLGSLAAAFNEVQGGSDATAASVAAMFKALDQSQRIDVLTAALDHMGGVAQQVANDTFGGQWAQLVAQWDALLVQAGQALFPVVSSLVDFTKVEIVPFLTSLIAGFNALPGPVKDVTVGVGLAAAATVPLAAGLAAVGLAVTGINSLMATLGVTSAQAAAGTETLATAQAAAVAPAEALATAEASVVASEEAGALATATATTSIASSIAIRVGLYGGLAAALVSAYGAWKQLQEAEAGVVAQNAELDKSLGVLEITMTRQGLDISDLKAQYASGQITLQQFMQGLRDMEVTYTNLHPPMAQAAADAQAHTDKLSLLKNAVKEAQDAVDKLTAAGVSQAGQSDKLLAADNALEAAQKAYNIALQGGHDAAQQAAKDQKEIAADASQVAVMLDKVPASFQADIASLSAGGAEGKKLESEIDSLITKFEKQAQTADGPVKSALVGMIAQLQAMKEMTAAAESPTDELGNKLLTLSDYIQAARNASIDLSTGTEKLTLDYEDAVTNLLVVHAEYVGGTKKLSDYEKAQNAVTKAQENLNDAEAAAGAKTSEATDDYSLLSVQLAIAKQKLEDVKNAYANDPMLAGKVQAAQREVTTLQNALNTALGQTPAAANAAAAGIDWVAAACGKAINQLFNLTAAMQSTFAAEDKTPLGSDVAQLQGSFSPPANKHFINSITPGPLGGAGETITAVPNQGYMNDPFDPTGAAVTYAVGELELAKAGRLNAQQINSLIANGTIPGGSYPTENGGTAGAAAASSSQGNLVMGGPVPTDLQALVTAGAGSAASSGAATTGTDEIALLQATLDAANTQAQAVEASYDAGTASLDQLNAAMAVVAAANTALYTAVNNNASTTIQNSSNIQALTSATAAAATAAQTSTTATTNVLGVMSNLTSSVVNLTTATVAQTAVSLKGVVGATTAIAGPGSGVVLGYGVAGTGGGTNVLAQVGTTTSYNNNGGNTPLVFNFQGANFSSASPDMVQAAVTQALRTAGARF